MNVMDIEQRLRQLHAIEADSAYVRDSRARLLTAARVQVPQLTWRTFVFGVFRSGTAIAVMSLFLFFAIGGSLWNLLSPFVVNSGWDSNTLQAEAQAIDTQVHLADLQYREGGYERQRLISPDTGFQNSPAVSDPGSVSETNQVATSSATSTGSGDASSTPAGVSETTSSQPQASSTTVGVPEALDLLSR